MRKLQKKKIGNTERAQTARINRNSRLKLEYYGMNQKQLFKAYENYTTKSFYKLKRKIKSRYSR
jgi:hypothetical protein